MHAAPRTQHHRQATRTPPLYMVRVVAITICLLLLAAASLGGLFISTEYWRFELLAHFRWPFFAAGCALVLVCLIGRHYLLLVAAFALLAVNSSMLVHHPLPPPQVTQAARNAPTTRAMSINVYSRNDDIDRVLRYVHEQSPDILALIEVTGKWLPHLDALYSEYPYQARQIWGQHFGSVLLSRYPLSQPPRTYGYSGVGSLARIADLPQGRCLIVLVHPIAPITEKTWSWNAASLADLGKYVNAAQQHTPVLVLGDFNASPWGRTFRTLLKDTSLRPPDSKRIWWPTWRLVSWPASIPIDHFLLSAALQDTHTWVGPNVGSDHYPIGIDFTITQPANR